MNWGGVKIGLLLLCQNVVICGGIKPVASNLSYRLELSILASQLQLCGGVCCAARWRRKKGTTGKCCVYVWVWGSLCAGWLWLLLLPHLHRCVFHRRIRRVLANVCSATWAVAVLMGVL